VSHDFIARERMKKEMLMMQRRNMAELTIQRRNMAAARKIKRVAQQQQHPVKYEQVKLNNRLATAKYDKKKER
jgi:hypothetical protein